MEPQVAAELDQQRAKAIDDLREAKSFIVITSKTHSPGDEPPDGTEVDVGVLLGCDQTYLITALDLVMRNVAVRAIFPEMFDEWGRVKRG